MPRQTEPSHDTDVEIELNDALNQQRNLLRHWSLMLQKSHQLEKVFNKLKKELEEIKEQPEELVKKIANKIPFDFALVDTNDASNSTDTLVPAVNDFFTITSNDNSAKEGVTVRTMMSNLNIINDDEKGSIDVDNSMPFSDSCEVVSETHQKNSDSSMNDVGKDPAIRRATENYNLVHVENENEKCHLAAVNDSNIVYLNEKDSPHESFDAQKSITLSMAPSSNCPSHHAAEDKHVHSIELDCQGPLNTSTIISSSFLSKKKPRARRRSLARRSCKSKSPTKRVKPMKTWRRTIRTRRLKSISF